LADRLAARYADAPHVRVLAGDVLALPLDALVPEREVTVVANLPYNVTTPILFRLLQLRTHFPRPVVMVQREAAERLVARAGRPGVGCAAGARPDVRRRAARVRRVAARVPSAAARPVRRGRRALARRAARRARRRGALSRGRPRRVRAAAKDAAERARPAGAR